jgi:hypothetical protein
MIIISPLVIPIKNLWIRGDQGHGEAAGGANVAAGCGES